jgi:hypothetical protein
MSGRVRLGDWTCPSGNNVEAFYRPLGDGLATLDMEWDDMPPLGPADAVYYHAVIRPALVRLVGAYTERTGSTLVVSA